MVLRNAWFVLLAAVFAGCLQQGEGPTLYLQYTLTNLGAAREAALGPHCGTAKVDGDVARVEQSEYERLGRARPFLMVEAEQGGNATNPFTTIGSEGYPLAFPAEIDPRINRTETVLSRIDYRDGSGIVDGAAVSLPYTWSRSESGNWVAAFQLTNGPSTVELFRLKNCM